MNKWHFLSIFLLNLALSASSAHVPVIHSGHEPPKIEISRPAHQLDPKDKNSSFESKKCLCLGIHSDGPLNGQCIIPCKCPGNCDKE